MERKDVKLEDVSPMMREYLKTKSEYEGIILFYRLGDFYEMFFDDALVASKELEITLTGKSCGQEGQQQVLKHRDSVADDDEQTAFPHPLGEAGMGFGEVIPPVFQRFHSILLN